jgi:(R,R)-butanediol dehydrogenase/meso-butanediol dehydrogenase/diacetyl reductase
MRAVRWHARDDVRLDDVPTPAPGPGEVVLRVEAAGICGTDLDEVRFGPVTVPVRPHPVSGRSAPMTLGHEIVGVVAEVGAATGLAVGTRVAPWPSGPCGRCRECLADHANRCPSTVALGMSTDGGMADFVLVRADRCVPIEPEAEPERAVLVEPYAVVLRALRHVAVAGRRVAVVGIGALGLCLVDATVRAGASAVVAVSRSAASRAVALEAGASAVAALEDAAGVDAEIAFETGGVDATVAASITAVRRGGTVVVLGGHVRPTPIDLLDLTVREIALRGSVSHDFADFAAAARAIGAGELARVDRPVELAPLEAGPALLRREAAAAKRILVPGLS